MKIKRPLHTRILERLDPATRATLSRNVKTVNGIEIKYKHRIKEAIEAFEAEALTAFLLGRPLPKCPDFELFYVEHFFETAILGFKTAAGEIEKWGTPKKRMARRPVPPSLPRIMKAYDLWRKKKIAPKLPKVKGREIKKLYLDKVKSVFEDMSKPYRAGETDLEEIRYGLRKAAKTTYSRSKTIINTQTTAYYNQARRDVYDRSDDVTHYLYLAIRDHRTTKWCTDKRLPEGRGRHGLVFKKGSALLNKSTPPCHWNCRSEITPLVPLNPAHKRLIDDKSLDAERIRLTPLPKGWNSQAA